MDLPTGEDIKHRREQELDITQEALARAAGVSQPLIARIENDDVDPRLSTLRKIMDAMDDLEGEVIRARDVMNAEPKHVEPDDSAVKARDTMVEHGFSQMPVLLNGKAEGMVEMHDVVSEDVDDKPVSEVMRSAIQSVEPDTPLETVQTKLGMDSAVLVTEEGQVVGIITEADIAKYRARRGSERRSA